MVTLSSCLIWQIISFILPPNEYGCAWTTLGSGPAIDLQKMPILPKEIIFSDEAYFDQAKLSHLEWILVQTHNWTIFLWKLARRGRYSQWRSLIEEEDIANIWFQQGGVTCHTAEATLNVLRPVFEDRIISRRGDVVWPPRSCDLTPLGYYL